MENSFRLYSDPFQYYHKMIKDIYAAKRYIYLETFRVGADVIGERFRSALIQARKKGVEVKILIDYWGAGPVKNGFFDALTALGGNVRYFKKINYNFDFFTRSHRRNHRKLLLIDDEITYIGSSNITNYNMNWRESVLRMESDITQVFKRLFVQDFKIYNRYIFSRAYYTRHIRYNEFEIVRDVPIITKKKINKKFIRLIQQSKESVVIETPYFLPGFMFRKAMMEAADRGVAIKVIIPKKSDVRLVDILRNKYLGVLSKRGIEFLYYEPNNLHAKLIVIDKDTFGIGSSNFDYRSFRYMFEIFLFGKQPDIVREIMAHNQKTIEATIPFNYDEWGKRPPVEKFFEWILLPFRHLL